MKIPEHKFKLIVGIIVFIAFGVLLYKIIQIKNTNDIYAPQDVQVENNVKLPQVANPASENCVREGGVLRIKTKEDGSQYGLCYFDDNRACEEWAMFRGECRVGGVKTTGYDTEAQRFCAWSGGKTLAVENAVCELPSGKVCSTDTYYNGVCTDEKTDTLN